MKENPRKKTDFYRNNHSASSAACKRNAAGSPNINFIWRVLCRMHCMVRNIGNAAPRKPTVKRVLSGTLLFLCRAADLS